MYFKVGKRVFDLFMASFSLLILSPFLLIIVILIKIFDPGPVIFKQSRVGIHGNLFLFYKFRSMPVNTGDISSDELRNIEITRIGKIIRRTNLDELPQLINILKGDMSIVGPRPPILCQQELIRLRRENGSINTLPGLTGLAQVKSFDGMSVEQKASFDGQYIEHISFVGDIRIIVKTFLYLFKSPPVY